MYSETLVIISDYSLILKEEFVFFVESSVTTHMCPICQATLRYRDSRPRIRKKEGGLKDQLIIRRFYCKNCHSYHNELPDCLVPYKHYETEVISGVLYGNADHGCLEKLQAAFCVGQVPYAWKYSL